MNIFDELPTKVCEKANKMLLWMENSQIVVKVKSENGDWQKKVGIKNNDVDGIIRYMENVLATKILIMKAEYSDKMNRTHEIATNQIVEDGKKKIEWSWPWT